jgi:hypothetical protein
VNYPKPGITDGLGFYLENRGLLGETFLVIELITVSEAEESVIIPGMPQLSTLPPVASDVSLERHYSPQ